MKSSTVLATGTTVVVNSIKMSSAKDDGTTHFAIDLTFSDAAKKSDTSTSYDVDGNTKVPGGAGYLGISERDRSKDVADSVEHQYSVIFALNAVPKILNASLSNNGVLGASMVTIEFILPSQKADLMYAGSTIDNCRIIDLQDKPVNISTQEYTSILVSPVSDKDLNTHVVMSFPA